MTNIVLIGPVIPQTKSLFDLLSDQYTIEFLGFHDYIQEDPLLYDSYLLTNFHDLTIGLMELEPDIVIYYPPYLNYEKCEENPDLANISNEEAIDHIKQVLEIFNSHLIFFSSDQVISKNSKELRSPGFPPNPKSVLGITLYQGENHISNRRNTTILRLSPFLVDYNVFSSDNDIQLLEIDDFIGYVKQIIENRRTGIVHLIGKLVKGEISRPVSLMKK